MRIDIVTLFPEMIACALDHSIVKRARDKGLIVINVVNLRDFTYDRHKTADDIPYGGGGGMVMKVEPIALALASLMPSLAAPNAHIDLPAPEPADFAQISPAVNMAFTISAADFEANATQTPPNEVNYSVLGSSLRPRVALTDPRGPRFTQETARQWAGEEHLILLCGHYEGVDERVRRYLVTDEVSVGDYILTGGELPALIIADALTRLQNGALGDEQAPDKDTFADDLLEYPHYTRPRDYAGWIVPDILLCGHHAQIERWRRWHQLRDTRSRRPDLFARLTLSKQDLKLLDAEEPTAPSNPKAAARLYPPPGTPGQEQAEPGAASPPLPSAFLLHGEMPGEIQSEVGADTMATSTVARPETTHSADADMQPPDA